jgi:hypothetical protein
MRGEQPYPFRHGDVQRRQVRQLLVVDMAGRDRLMEDRRIGGHSDHVLVPYQRLQIS